MAVALGFDMALTKVRDLMTVEVERLMIGETLDIAKAIMENRRIRHIPVVDAQNRLVGLVTHRDIIRSWLSHGDPVHEEPGQVAREIPVEMLMTKDVRGISPDTLAGDAADMLMKHKYGCFPVVENERLIGIITEADFVRFAADEFANQAHRRPA